MLPFISGERDSVVLAKTDNIKLYDIVLAIVNENQYVLHRVIKIMGNKLILMGDGNLKGCEICTIECDSIAYRISGGTARGFDTMFS